MTVSGYATDVLVDATRSAIAAIEISFRRPIDVIRNDEIEPAVVVVIEPCCA